MRVAIPYHDHIHRPILGQHTTKGLIQHILMVLISATAFVLKSTHKYYLKAILRASWVVAFTSGTNLTRPSYISSTRFFTSRRSHYRDGRL
jgi:hypothetical protein